MSDVTADRQNARRESLRLVAPSKGNPRIAFPDQYQQGRIVVVPGGRLLDWEGGEWVPYEKEGVRWNRESFKDSDYEALRDALSPQI